MGSIERIVKIIAASLAIATSAFDLPSLAQENLVANLRQGGYVIYFRHGTASQEARPAPDLPQSVKDCTGERHITEASLPALKTVGERFRTLNIPVGKVISSPACTAKETAWYTFAKSLEVAPTLDGNPRPSIWTELHPFLTTKPTEGTNTVLVAHGTNLKALTGIAIAEGEAVIFQPDGQGGFTWVTRLTPEAWTSLTQ
jgi:phosphohistidine phosphatase SixA